MRSMGAKLEGFGDKRKLEGLREEKKDKQGGLSAIENIDINFIMNTPLETLMELNKRMQY